MLNLSLSVARKRKLGDAAWGWSRATSASDITATVAATLSLWALASSEFAAKPKVMTGRALFA